MTSIIPEARDLAGQPVSIVIITHNRQREVLRALRSARAQTIPALEIIVVDDGSTPAIVLGDLGGTDSGPPLRLIRNDQAVGPSAARNCGILAASGTWIAFLDDDDQFEIEKLAVISRCIEQRGSNTDVFYHPARIIMVNEGVEYISSPSVPANHAALCKSLLVKNIVGGTPMVVARKTALESAGLFDESLRALEDYDLWLRMATAGSRFSFVADPLTRCDYATAKASVTKSDAAGIKTFRQIASTYAAEFSELTPREQREHAMWIHEIELHRAMLRLGYLETIRSAWRLLIKFPSIKYGAALAASFLGPKTMIRIRSRRAA